MYRADTIVAPATPAGRAAIAVVRLSGPDAIDIAERLLRSKRTLRDVPAWSLGRFSALDLSDGRVIDDVLVVRMPAPRSYTGEDVVEIHCHGSAVVVEALIGGALLAGARLAEPGEFTRRAVLNGRMDLTQAEAVADLIEAPVLSGAKAAWERLTGALSTRVFELRARLVSILSYVEAYIDFSDDDLPDEDSRSQLRALSDVGRDIEGLLSGFAAARREHAGLRVVLVGKPNVGKSSLLNSLVGFDRAIVSCEAGTTRDALMETVDVRGFAFVITDTAGVRETANVSESLAVARSRQEASNADILVRVFDGSCPLDETDCAILNLPFSATPGICVINKADLPVALTEHDRRRLIDTGCTVVPASAVRPGGCDRLRHALVAASREMRGDPSESAGFNRERHRAALERALAAVVAAQSLMSNGEHADLASIELRRALAEISGITEPLDNEQVLDVIFASFCLGK